MLDANINAEKCVCVAGKLWIAGGLWVDESVRAHFMCLCFTIVKR